MLSIYNNKRDTRFDSPFDHAQLYISVPIFSSQARNLLKVFIIKNLNPNHGVIGNSNFTFQFSKLRTNKIRANKKRNKKFKR